MRFMQGRNGFDQLSQFLNMLVLVIFVISLFVKWPPIYYLGLGLLVYMYFRVFSRNIPKRYAENQKFLSLKNKWAYKWENHKRLREQKKVYHIYNCPYCKQKIRIPKGKGSIIITCPKCKQEFGKRS